MKIKRKLGNDFDVVTHISKELEKTKTLKPVVKNNRGR